MDSTFRWGIYDREPLTSWSTNRITLLGDSAHAVTPHLGQGANQAVEDAITLAVVLADARPTEIADRLRRYHALRIDRNRQVRDGSRNAGMLYRSTGLVPDLQAEKIVDIFGGLDLTTYDAERVARDAGSHAAAVRVQATAQGRSRARRRNRRRGAASLLRCRLELDRRRAYLSGASRCSPCRRPFRTLALSPSANVRAAKCHV